MNTNEYKILKKIIPYAIIIFFIIESFIFMKITKQIFIF